MDPGLVYDIASADDFVDFFCDIGYHPNETQIITGAPVNCPRGRNPSPENLNYPSFVAMFPASFKGVAFKKFKRTVTNVGPINSVYLVSVDSPVNAVVVTVRPSRLLFSEARKKRSYVVTVAADTQYLEMGQSGAMVFVSLSWTDGKHVVRSPIVVTTQ